MFKLDVITKIKNTVWRVFKENPELYVFSDSTNSVEYFRFIIPLLCTNLCSEELNVFIEIMCLEISGTYNDVFYKYKNFYESIILFKVDPEVAIIKFGGVDETKGFGSLKT